MSEQYPPGPEHSFLRRKVGTWDVSCEYFFDPSREPVRAEGVDIVEAVGDYWIVARGSFELPGLTVVGQALTGYDPVEQRFVGTWFDSATPFLYSFEGLFDTERDLLEMTGMNIDPQTGRPVHYRSKELFGAPDARLFELLVESTPGMETQILRYEYTRRD